MSGVLVIFSGVMHKAGCLTEDFYTWPSEEELEKDA
jgi:hypothetical protein